MKPAKKIINYFDILKSKNIIGSSYIFIGNNFLIINKLLKLINCTESEQFCSNCWSCRRIDDQNHPDLFVVEPDGVSIKISQVREAIRFLSRSSYYAPKKNLIIKNAQKLTKEASNLFLKTLEEPPKNSFIGLICTKLEDVLPTIISRCRKIYLPYSEHKTTKSVKDLENILESSYFGPKKRKDFSLFLESLIILLHKRLKNNLSHEVDQDLVRLFSNIDFDETIVILEDVFKIYKACDTININLALNLIKMRLRCN